MKFIPLLSAAVIIPALFCPASRAAFDRNISMITLGDKEIVDKTGQENGALIIEQHITAIVEKSCITPQDLAKLQEEFASDSGYQLFRVTNPREVVIESIKNPCGDIAWKTFFAAIRANIYNIVAALVDAGINLHDQSRKNPLIWAVENRRPKIASLIAFAAASKPMQYPNQGKIQFTS